ncbi:MAG: 50S ribosomal protein L3 [Minisyncoccia bacterium]
MKKFILAQKIGMTEIFQNDKMIPVTVLEAGPVVVTQIKTKEKDGYCAVQVGFGKKKKISKALKGHLKDLGNFKWLKEFRVDESEINNYKVGDKIDLSIFQEGEKIKISGTSKSKGFQGVVKRHGFHGGPKTHGQKNRLRAPGSIGATHPQHVPKGRKMAGRMGGERITLKNVKIAKIINDKNIICVKGAVPGKKGDLVEISA